MTVDDRGGPGIPGGQPELSRLKDALHTPFELRLDGTRSVELTLQEIVSLDTRAGWESFSLIFSGPSPPVFWDGMFDVEHADLPAFSIFVVAVVTDGDGQQYEAVFHRRST